MNQDPEEVIVGLQDVDREILGIAAGAPRGVRVVPPGEDLSTFKVDVTASVTDRRTPETVLAMEAFVVQFLGVTRDQLRLINAVTGEHGQATLWEVLPVELNGPDRYLVSWTRAGSNRVRCTTMSRLNNARAVFVEACSMLEVS